MPINQMLQVVPKIIATLITKYPDNYPGYLYNYAYIVGEGSWIQHSSQ